MYEIFLGTTKREFLSKKGGFYREFCINGGPYRYHVRKICVPKQNLKRLQSHILTSILLEVAPHRCATAYFPGNTILRNAKLHQGAKFLFKTDIKDFFGSIGKDRLIKLLQDHYPSLNEVAVHDVAEIASLNGSLPQGAPTSPHLSNVAMKKFDANIALYCSDSGVSYSRYSDDICISGNCEETVLLARHHLLQKLVDDGFQHNSHKTILCGPDSPKIVSGLDVSRQHIRPTKKFRKKTQTLVRMAVKFPKTGEQVKDKVLGRLSFWKSISPNDPELLVLSRAIRGVFA